MDIFATYKRQLEISGQEFASIIDGGEVRYTAGGIPRKLRLEVIDGSAVDVFLASSGKYSYHWERRHIDGSLYRHDNAPHHRWRHIPTFPKHFHNGSEADENIEPSQLADHPEEALRQFLAFRREKIIVEG